MKPQANPVFLTAETHSERLSPAALAFAHRCCTALRYVRIDRLLYPKCRQYQTVNRLCINLLERARDMLFPS